MTRTALLREIRETKSKISRAKAQHTPKAAHRLELYQERLGRLTRKLNNGEWKSRTRKKFTLREGQITRHAKHGHGQVVTVIDQDTALVYFPGKGETLIDDAQRNLSLRVLRTWQPSLAIFQGEK